MVLASQATPRSVRSPKAPTVACSPSNVLRGATPLAVDDALRFAPIFPDLESIPDLSVTALDEIEAVRIRVNGYLHRELTQDAPTVASDESKQRSLSLEVPRTSAILAGKWKSKWQ